MDCEKFKKIIKDYGNELGMYPKAFEEMMEHIAQDHDSQC